MCPRSLRALLHEYGAVRAAVFLRVVFVSLCLSCCYSATLAHTARVMAWLYFWFLASMIVAVVVRQVLRLHSLCLFRLAAYTFSLLAPAHSDGHNCLRYLWMRRVPLLFLFAVLLRYSLLFVLCIPHGSLMLLLFFCCMRIVGRLAGHKASLRCSVCRSCSAAAPEPSALRLGGNKGRRFARWSRALGHNL